MKVDSNKTSKPTSSRILTITGLVLGTDFSRTGKVLEVAIETENFEQYIISQSRMGKELFNLLLANVTAHGNVLGMDPDGNAILQVNDYRINERFD